MAETTFIDVVVSVRRVTKVTKGGKRFSFSAFVVSGDGKGKVGIGFGRSRDVSSAIMKATVRARKSLFEVFTRGSTLPFDVSGRHGSSRVVIRPAYKGTGLIAGGAVRAVMRALGIQDVLAKSIGPSGCGINLVKATLNALAKCRSAQRVAHLRGKTIEEIVKGSHGVSA
ncbi:MAG: 30S ribosomal protein S5 [Candidatus Babeliaceae bacterium]|nr:30S ribosomal protein S5 [Candidatus Babeliaceae bacterium]